MKTLRKPSLNLLLKTIAVLSANIDEIYLVSKQFE